MEVLAIVAAMIFIPGSVVFWHYPGKGRARQAQARALHRAAAALGLRWQFTQRSAVLSGEIDGFLVLVEEQQLRGGRWGLRITVESPEGASRRIPRSMSLFCDRTLEERPWSSDGDHLTRKAGDIVTGDGKFDRFCRLGDETVARAVMGAGERAAVGKLLPGKVMAIEEGRLRLDVAGGAESQEQAVFLVTSAVRCAAALSWKADTERRLARNALEDPVAAVRLRCLEALVDGFPAHPATADALSRAMGDGDPAVRLAAVAALGEIGTARAVAPLRALVADGTLEFHSREVRAAVAAIQSRIEGAGAGRVSLAEAGGPEGAVSLAGEGEEGRLSLERAKEVQGGGER